MNGFDTEAGAPSPALPPRRRRAAAGCGDAVRRAVDYKAAPNVCHYKTLPAAWAALRSRWRYAHAASFAIGPPLHLLARIWPPLLLNCAVFAVVSADHIVSTASAAAGAHRYLFPPLSASVAASLDPAYRLSLFAVALLLTLRMGRVYERWWAARSAMSGLGSACLQIAVRARLWAGEAAADEVGRWAVAWQFSLWQVLTNAPAPHPALRALLPPPAYAVLAASPKPRQVSVAQIMRLMEPTLRARDSLAAPFYILLDRATAAAGTLTGIQLQALPIAITYTCTGFVELFLATYPLTGLAVKSGRSGGAAAAGGGHMHDDSLTSVIWTLAIQFFLYIIMNLLFLGADEVASMMENPYAEIPLEELAKTTPRDVVRMWAELRALDEVGGGGGGGRGGKAGLAGTDERWRAALKICAKTR